MLVHFLDQFENAVAERYGVMVYEVGPFSLWGSIVNAVVSGVLAIAGLVILVTQFQPYLLLVAGVLHVFFVLIAVRVYNGRTLYDRELMAEMDDEESGGADELPPR